MTIVTFKNLTLQFKAQKEDRTMTPHKCPVCNGDKRIPLAPKASMRLELLPRWTKPCHACQGTGIVWSET